MIINVPAALKPHAPFIKEFFEGMMFKLLVNAHKDDTVEKDIPILINRGLDELEEFRDQLQDKKNDPNTLQELFDMSNFNYLLFKFLREQGVPDEREQFVREFFRVDTVQGKVYAKKTRSGSRYKEGDEISGTKRSGKVYIRIQHVVSGSMINCSRSDVVWFCAHGKWPDAALRHLDDDLENDGIANLELIKDDVLEDDKYPFVYSISEGVYGYQRRHRGVVVRVGSWGSKPDAAVEGIKQWKAKVKENFNV